MLLTVAIIQALLSAAALAHPTSRDRLHDRIQRRQSTSHISNPAHSFEPLALINNVANVQYTGNWAGAALVDNNGTYTSVTGNFVVPTPKAPTGASKTGYYSASAWVGIDGLTCDSAILQTGIDLYYDGGSVDFLAWYEWWPAYALYFETLSISAGDTIKLTVTATSSTTGTATIENVTTRKSVSTTLTSTSPLCQANADWIVEDFTEDGGLVDFVNFGTVKFTSASATTSSGAVLDPSNATVVDIEQDGQVLTNSSASASSVVITYG